MGQFCSCALQGQHLSIRRRSRGAVASFALALTLGLLCMGCSTKKETPQAREVDLSGIWDTPVETRLSEIATDIEYIPLETTTECLLGDPGSIKVVVQEKYIAVNSNGIHLFDRQGKFLRKIGRIGLGPQEYSSSNQFVIDEKGGFIHVLNGNSSRFVTYRITGEFVREIPLAQNGSKLILDESGNIGVMFLPNSANLNDSARFEWLNPIGEKVKTIPLYQGRPRDGGDTYSMMASLFLESNILTFAEAPFDTLYQLTDEQGWKPKWILNTGLGKMPREVWLSIDRWADERHDYRSLILNSESSRYLFFEAENRGKFGIVIYDKNDAQGRWIPERESADETRFAEVRNDLDGGLPIRMNILNRADGDVFINLFSPLDIITHSKDQPISGSSAIKPGLHEKFMKLAGSLKEDDNPVVMMVRMKN